MTQETYDALEARVLDNLTTLEYEQDEKKRRTLVDETARLTELVIAADKEDSERLDKAERRRIDEFRNNQTAAIEMAKQDLTWKKVIFELAKAVVPLGISICGYDLFQKRLLRFEENGRLTSHASRELHLPNFFKK